MLMLNGCQQDKRLLMGYHGDHCMSCNIEMLCTEVKIFLLGSGLNTQCIQLAVDSDGTMMELCNNKKKHYLKSFNRPDLLIIKPSTFTCYTNVMKMMDDAICLPEITAERISLIPSSKFKVSKGSTETRLDSFLENMGVLLHSRVF